AHSRGLLHRDVKPPNILLTNPERGRRRVLLADFGIARNAGEVSTLTDTNVTLGTVNYASPEQLMGAALDGRADQYGLAATAYHLLTGSPMFGASNPAVVIGRHLNAPAPRLSETRPELARLDPVLAKALSKNPADRFPTCTDFAAALRRAVETPGTVPPRMPVPAPAPPARPPAPPLEQRTSILPADYPVEVADQRPAAAGRSRWPWALAGLALVMILAALVFAVWPRAQQTSAPPSTSTSRAPTTSRPTTTASMPTTTSSSPSAVPVTFDSMRDLVTGFYAELPGNARAAWNKLDGNYQQRNGLDDYLSFWSTIESVSVLSVTPRDATSVVATIRYVLRNGGVDTENRWLSVAPRDGQLLIHDSERIGPA
ncbi:MAG: protein kinase domain-containing protein, partial [Mycobacterium sp.]